MNIDQIIHETLTQKYNVSRETSKEAKEVYVSHDVYKKLLDSCQKIVRKHKEYTELLGMELFIISKPFKEITNKIEVK